MQALQTLDGRRELHQLIESHIRQQSIPGEELKILEAGCGRRWPIDLEGVRFHLTGIDIDEQALEHRKKEVADLNEAVLSDLLSADLSANTYDVVYSSFVLEHVRGAEAVLQNFVKWLKPGGLLVLTFPDRDSVYGFFTRITPFWVHVLYKKYVEGRVNAGKPGFGPYPTFHENIISRRNFHEFADNRGLIVLEERGFGKLPPLQSLFTKTIGLISFKSLSSDHIGLLYILKKGLENSDSSPASSEP